MTSEQITVTDADQDAAWKAFENWFFRECVFGARRHLYAMFDMPMDEIRTHGDERHVLRYIRKRLQGVTNHRTEAEARVLKHAEASPAVSDDMVERVIRHAQLYDTPNGDSRRRYTPAQMEIAIRAAIAAMSPQRVNSEALSELIAGDADLYDTPSARITGDKDRENPVEGAQPAAWMYDHVMFGTQIFETRWDRRAGGTSDAFIGWTETPLYRHPPASGGKPA